MQALGFKLIFTCLCLIFSVTFPLIRCDDERDCLNCKKNASSPLQLKDLVPDNYDKLVPPMENGEPVVVEIRISILNIQYVDEVKQIFGADIFFHQIWRDHRVRLPPNYHADKMVLDNQWRKEIWTPDTYFKNSLDGKVTDIIIPYSYMVVNGSGNLFYASRVSLKLSCEMSLESYPHDVQECDLSVMSLQHTNETMVLKWKGFKLTKSLLLAQYYVRDSREEVCTKKYEIGTFSCLRGKIKLARRLGYFLINRYIPCVLIVCMSFVTFWIPAEAYPAQVTLSVTSLLTIVTQQYQSSMPSVSYVVALNIWMLSCIGFVFFSLLEYAFVIAVMNQKSANICPFHSFKKLFFPKSSTVAENETGAERSPGNSTSCTASGSTKFTYTAIDRISRFVFPVFFFIFCFCYLMVFTYY